MPGSTLIPDGPYCYHVERKEVRFIDGDVILKLMSENAEQEGMSPLQSVMVVNDVVPGMTDSFPLRMYQPIFGINLPRQV